MADRPTTLAGALPLASISLRERHADRESAVRRTGALLAAGGEVDEAYTDEMVAALGEYGPYIVVAPGVALAHARPSRSVHGVAFSVLTLDPPVAFGHADNDPVRLIVGLAAPDAESHIEALRQMAELLGDDAARERLMSASEVAEVRAMVEGAAG